MKASTLLLSTLSTLLFITSCQADDPSFNSNETEYFEDTSKQVFSNAELREFLNKRSHNFTYSSQTESTDDIALYAPQESYEKSTNEVVVVKNDALELPNQTTIIQHENHDYASVQNVLQVAHSQSKPVFPKDPSTLYVHKQLTSNYIDSINEIEEIIPEGVFHDLSISYFQPLAEQLCGKAFFAEQSEEIVPVISSILNSRLSPNTDIILLIDKTGSMEDDIYNVKQGLTVIKDILSTYKGINVCIASYGDKNYHGDLWYNASPLTDDLSIIESFIEGYSIIGNPDTPESVNDAIVKVTSEINWTPGNDRMMLVIGDAPSQEGEMSEHSLEEVVEHCAAMDVTFNLYPIIISMSSYTPVKEVTEVSANLYPNPAANFLKITLEDSYEGVEFNVFDQNGKLLLTRNAFGENTIEIDVSSYPNGLYYVQLEDGDLDHMCVKKFIVQH